MKYFYLLFIFVVLGCGVHHKGYDVSPQKRVAVQNRIDNKDFKIIFDNAFPQSSTALANAMQKIDFSTTGSSIAAINIRGNGYYIKIEGDTVSANLPFYGERYSGYSALGDDAIEFKGIPQTYSSTTTDNKTIIKFEIDDKQNSIETYTIVMNIYADGTTDLTVSSTQRSSIRYRGQMVLKEAEEAT